MPVEMLPRHSVDMTSSQTPRMGTYLPSLSSLEKCSPSQEVGSSRICQRCQGGGVLTKSCSVCLPPPLPPSLNDNSLEGALPPQWMSDLCFAFSPALGTRKQSTELCVLGQLSLLKSQERGSCLKPMKKGQGTRADLGAFGPSLSRMLQNYCLPYG